MAPEMFITEKEKKKVVAWVKSNPSSEEESFMESEAKKYCTIFTVNNEPLVIGSTFGEHPDDYGRLLSCSNNHARELEKKGIVKFPELPLKK